MAITFNWAVVKSLAAEIACTFVFAFAVYNSSVGAAVVENAVARPLLVGLSVGMAGIAVIYAFMDITIAHFNPAITFATIITGKMPIFLGLCYIVAQCLGAMLAAGVMLGCNPGTNLGLLNTVRAQVNPLATKGEALFMEAVLTGILTYVAFSVAINVFNPPTQVKIEVPDADNSSDKLRVVTSQVPNRSAFAPIAIGLTLGFLAFLGLGSSGGAFNPALVLAPVLFSGRWYNVWLYWVGEFAGGAVAGLLHVLVFAKTE